MTMMLKMMTKIMMITIPLLSMIRTIRLKKLNYDVKDYHDD